MRIVWTIEALEDLENIIVYYYENVGPETAEAIERRIVQQVENLHDYPERVRESDRVPGTRETVIKRLPYIAFIRVTESEIQVLNIVHTARKFPV